MTVVALAIATIVVVGLVVTAPSDADRVAALGEQIKCPVCQGESIGNSPATMARDMMALVEERVAGGASDQEIIDELLSSYSGAVLLDPPVGGSTLILWLAPFAALAVGAVVILWWRRHPGERDEDEHAPPNGKQRKLIGGLILVGSIAGAVIIAALSVEGGTSPAAGVADQQVDDLDNVSNETMEAVVAANLDHPAISGMRLALAERYYEANDYHSAFPHYLAVAQLESSTPDEVLTSLIRLGWMAWDGNGEAEAAVGLFDEALEVDPGSSTAMYLKAQVLWCGLDDDAGAAFLFESILDDPELSDESRATVTRDLDAVLAGEPCP